MIEFLTHHALASNWTVWEHCLELRKMGAQLYGTSLGQMERTSSPGDSNDNELAVHVVQWDNRTIIGYARMHPRPIGGSFDASRPNMRLELERVCLTSKVDAAETAASENLRKLITAIVGYARSHDYDVISGYGEPDGVTLLEAFDITITALDTGISDGKRMLCRYDLAADDENSRALCHRANEDSDNLANQSSALSNARDTAKGHDVLEELEEMFGVDMTACRRTFEHENLTMEAA